MHWEPIEETSNGILYSETLNDYFIDEKDERSPVEISAVIHHHMAIKFPFQLWKLMLNYRGWRIWK
ncbi:Uncharacterized protein APZ42_007618 [Daphnia magna]|uniref:Uncharacterized protein n=1 Tax=Daphnia magna TaxID=35525 RepID=A0A164F6T5_9CRUS|nr:Uncharacterized protein APZ42_007618 [Daphnia magna]